jgi:hypothetical protein
LLRVVQVEDFFALFFSSRAKKCRTVKAINNGEGEKKQKCFASN